MNPAAKLFGDTKFDSKKEHGSSHLNLSALQDKRGAFIMLDEVTETV